MIDRLLRAASAFSDVSNDQLAGACGVNRATASAWLRGRYQPGRERAAQLGSVLPLQMDVLDASLASPQQAFNPFDERWQALYLEGFHASSSPTPVKGPLAAPALEARERLQAALAFMPDADVLWVEGVVDGLLAARTRRPL